MFHIYRRPHCQVLQLFRVLDLRRREIGLMHELRVSVWGWGKGTVGFTRFYHNAQLRLRQEVPPGGAIWANMQAAAPEEILQTTKPKPQTLNPKPILISKPWNTNPKSQTLGPKLNPSLHSFESAGTALLHDWGLSGFTVLGFRV